MEQPFKELYFHWDDCLLKYLITFFMRTDICILPQFLLWSFECTQLTAFINPVGSMSFSLGLYSSLNWIRQTSKSSTKRRIPGRNAMEILSFFLREKKRKYYTAAYITNADVHKVGTLCLLCLVPVLLQRRTLSALTKPFSHISMHKSSRSSSHNYMHKSDCQPCWSNSH